MLDGVKGVVIRNSPVLQPPGTLNQLHSMNGNRTFRIGVLGSGKGSNFVAIAEACAAGSIPAEVALVLSDVADAGILDRARERNIAVRFVAPGKFRTKLDEESERAFIQGLRDASVDLVVLAGFMRVLRASFSALSREES